MKKDLLGFAGMTQTDLEESLRTTLRLKRQPKDGKEHASLKVNTLRMIFSSFTTKC